MQEILQAKKDGNNDSIVLFYVRWKKRGAIYPACSYVSFEELIMHEQKILLEFQAKHFKI